MTRVLKKRRRELPISANTSRLLQVVRAGYTRVNFGKFRMCNKLEVLVDRAHLDGCNLLISKRNVKLTEFNSKLEQTSIYNMEGSLISKIKEHFKELKAKIHELELSDVLWPLANIYEKVKTKKAPPLPKHIEDKSKKRRRVSPKKKLCETKICEARGGRHRKSEKLQISRQETDDKLLFRNQRLVTVAANLDSQDEFK